MLAAATLIGNPDPLMHAVLMDFEDADVNSRNHKNRQCKRAACRTQRPAPQQVCRQVRGSGFEANLEHEASDGPEGARAEGEVDDEQDVLFEASLETSGKTIREWRSIRFRLAPRKYLMWVCGPSALVVGLSKPQKKIPTQNISPFLFACLVALDDVVDDPAVVVGQHQRRHAANLKDKVQVGLVARCQHQRHHRRHHATPFSTPRYSPGR